MSSSVGQRRGGLRSSSTVTSSLDSSPLSRGSSRRGEDQVRATGSSNDPGPVEQDSLYFLPSTFVFFQVKRRLFCVPTYKFVNESQVFTQLFKLPLSNNDTKVKGSCQEDPIVLPDVTEHAFQSLLKVFYPLSVSVSLELSTSEWISVLDLSTRWYFLKYRKLAISYLGKKLNHIFKIRSGRACKIRAWIEDGCAGLVKQKSTISKDNAAQIGVDTALALFRIREEYIKKNSVEGVMELIREALKDELNLVDFAEAKYWTDEVCGL